MAIAGLLKVSVSGHLKLCSAVSVARRVFSAAYVRLTNRLRAAAQLEAGELVAKGTVGTRASFGRAGKP